MTLMLLGLRQDGGGPSQVRSCGTRDHTEGRFAAAGSNLPSWPAAKLAASPSAADLPQKITYNSSVLNGGFMLIGREKEAKMLLSGMRSDKSEFVAVFGRRRTCADICGQGGHRQSCVHHDGHAKWHTTRRELVRCAVRDHCGRPLRRLSRRQNGGCPSQCPVEGGFKTAYWELPSYRSFDVEGFSEDELVQQRRYLESMAHLII